MTETFKERELFILRSFQKDKTWEEKYRRVIKWGAKLDPLEVSVKKDKWLVKGCQSKVWLIPQKKEERLIFKGDSDALITKGLLSLVIYFYSGSSFQNILKTPPRFIENLELDSHLTPTRAGGLKSLVQQIHHYARAFDIMDRK